MRHKRSLISVCCLAFLAMVLWTPPGSRESLAQETAKAISKAKSVRFQMTQSVVVTLGGKTHEMKIEGKAYWRGSGAHRTEMSHDGKAENVSIMFPDKPGISIDHRRRLFRTTGPHAGQQSPMIKIAQLGQFSGKSDRELGEKNIDGIRSRGFEIAMNKVDDAAGNGTMEVWVAAKTHLPVRVVYNMKFEPQDAKMVMEKFEWNVALDELLFNASPPPGYTDDTPTPPETAELVKQISAALKVYSKAFDGRYPRGKTVYGDVVISALGEKLGLSGLTPAEQSQQEAYSDYAASRRGFSMLTGLLRHNPKATWNGSTVTAKDKDKVLLSWQTPDGFQVLFGDLKTKAVASEEELKKLLN